MGLRMKKNPASIERNATASAEQKARAVADAAENIFHSKSTEKQTNQGTRTMKKKITRAEYMENSHELFHAYYAQFVIEETRQFVAQHIGIKKLRKSKDEHFNDIIHHSNNGQGGWIWDSSPLNLELARELGEIHPGYLGSQSTHTCVGKEAARQLLEESKG